MTLRLKRISSEGLQAYLEESRGLERDYMGEILTSRKQAWRVAMAGGLITLFALSAAILGVSQKAPAPVVLRVDNATGAVEEITTMKEQEVTYGEVIDNYWLNQYVRNRESYDYDTLQTLYDTTAILSTPEVQKEYHALFEGPLARDQQLKDHTRIKVYVRSIIPGTDKGQATVRFATQELNANHTSPLRSFIATISYQYVNLPMSTETRRLNPLGFQVTSYRADPETLRSGGNGK